MWMGAPHLHRRPYRQNHTHLANHPFFMMLRDFFFRSAFGIFATDRTKNRRKCVERHGNLCARLGTFLYRGGPNDPKMLGYVHPTVAMILIYTITPNAMLIFENLLLGSWKFTMDAASEPLRLAIAVGLISYLAIIITLRVYILGPRHIYDSLWGCNQGLFIAALGGWSIIDYI